MIIMREDLMCKLVNYKKEPVLLTVLQKFYTASNTANQEYLNVGELSNCYWCLCLSTWRTSQTSILFLVTAWKTLSNMYCKQVVLIQDSLIDEPILVLIYFFFNRKYVSSFRESRSGKIGSILDTIGILLTFTAVFLVFIIPYNKHLS